MALSLKGVFNQEQRQILLRYYQKNKNFLNGLSFCDWLKSYVRNNKVFLLKDIANARYK